MSICIQYSRPASGKTENEIFGFDVAVTNFLSAYFKYSRSDQFICRPTDLPSFDHFKELAAASGVDADKRCIGLDPRHPQQNLQSISCLFRPDPLTADPIWRRQQVAGRGYATCGLVHTMSGERIARAVGDLCLTPSDSADALICPSGAIRDAVRKLWEIYAEYLNDRFGGKFKCPVQTPVIPLGIDTEKFSRVATPGKRQAQRAALNAGDDEILILFVGRLSFATKAHPLPLLMAAERAARQTGKKVRLILYGYFKPADMEPPFRELAADFCQQAKVDFITNNDPRFPDSLWAGADIFVSLSDNIQESFGLTPIEAMACGLPVVASDWDGYREGVRHGEDGFLIPSVTPPQSAGLAIARSYYNFENYGLGLMGTVQSTAVDIAACAAALTTLIEDPHLRRRMGDSGKKRAQETFDWRHIIRAYENLWQHLAEQRQNQPVHKLVPDNWQAAHPAFPNPWAMFGGFPSRQLAPSDILCTAMAESEIEKILRHNMNYFAPDMLLPPQDLIELAALIRRAGRARIQDILAAFPAAGHDVLWRCLGWLLKHGVCVIEP